MKTKSQEFARAAAEIAEQMLDVTVEARLPEHLQFRAFLARREAVRAAARARLQAQADAGSELRRVRMVLAAFSR